MIGKSSKAIHFLLLISFCFPFFYTGCHDSSKEEKKAAREKYIQDSLKRADDSLFAVTGERAGVDSASDNINSDSVKYDVTEDAEPQLNTATKFPAIADSMPSYKLQNRFPFLKRILVPEDETYTGIAVMVDSIVYFRLYALPLGFLLLILALLFKYIQKEAQKAIFILEMLGVAAVLAALPVSIFAERRWGYFAFAGIAGLLLFIDFLRLLKTAQVKNIHDSANQNN